VVSADGEVLHASEDENEDLFWALRGGGGGNFGIVTSFRFQLRPVSNVALYYVSWPWDDVSEVLDAWQHWAPTADRRLGSGFGLGHPDSGVIGASGQFNGSEDELRGLLEPLLLVGTPSAPEISTVTYMDAVERYAGSPVTHSIFKNTGAFVTDLWDEQGISTFVERMRATPSESNYVGFFAGGGAIADIEPSATAFVHRNALYDVQYQAYWEDDAETDDEIAWVDAIRDAMQPLSTGGYVNYIDANQSDWAAAYYGSNLGRLSEIKAKYDPQNVFDGPQSIPLADA
jgi:FAD/FMN-containing dehydrogenase